MYGEPAFIAVLTWLSPTMQDLRPGNDDFFSPNAIALICAFGVFFAQFLSRSERSWNLAAIFLAVTLLRTLSKTTIVAFIAGEALMLLRDSAVSRRKLLAILVISCLVVAAFWGLIQAYFEVYTTTGNQAETLTGRVGIWDYVLESVARTAVARARISLLSQCGTGLRYLRTLACSQ